MTGKSTIAVSNPFRELTSVRLWELEGYFERESKFQTPFGN